ncbi:hypothetical protein ACJRO7_006953 [Eucalyptus globulus]|uniref:Uncharacterized protein n=1 Tax=Eucalyptus globulus TaxID=34317 RepID=A0ABD3IL49_EUCGL
MSAAEHVLELFDSFWFHCAVFSGKPASPPPPPPSSSSAMRPPSHEDRGDEDDDRLLLETKLSRAPTLRVRSMSDQFLGGPGLDSDPFSPNSVLLAATPKLQTILSGKEVSDFKGEPATTKSEEEMDESQSQPGSSKKSENSRRRNRKKRSKSSKSLSELEFEELKGFMDLGFVFSEQDRDDSDLVSILPGLQRLGLKDDGDRIEVEDTKKADETKVPRPYLSEAWHGLDRQRKRYEDPLVNWRVPALGNEMAMKDHLKFWAHAVASTVR